MPTSCQLYYISVCKGDPKTKVSINRYRYQGSQVKTYLWMIPRLKKTCYRTPAPWISYFIACPCVVSFRLPLDPGLVEVTVSHLSQLSPLPCVFVCLCAGVFGFLSRARPLHQTNNNFKPSPRALGLLCGLQDHL